jgi:isocitrate dehydrogenase
MLTQDQLSSLRSNGDISSNEIAWVSGDLVVAENVLTGDKRILFESAALTEGKRILKG